MTGWASHCMLKDDSKWVSTLQSVLHTFRARLYVSRKVVNGHSQNPSKGCDILRRCPLHGKKRWPRTFPTCLIRRRSTRIKDPFRSHTDTLQKPSAHFIPRFMSRLYKHWWSSFIKANKYTAPRNGNRSLLTSPHLTIAVLHGTDNGDYHTWTDYRSSSHNVSPVRISHGTPCADTVQGTIHLGLGQLVEISGRMEDLEIQTAS